MLVVPIKKENIFFKYEKIQIERLTLDASQQQIEAKKIVDYRLNLLDLTPLIGTKYFSHVQCVGKKCFCKKAAILFWKLTDLLTFNFN